MCFNELTCLVHLLSPAGQAALELDAVNIFRRLCWAFASPASSLFSPVSISAPLASVPSYCTFLSPSCHVSFLPLSTLFLLLISPSHIFFILSLRFSAFVFSNLTPRVIFLLSTTSLNFLFSSFRLLSNPLSNVS